MDVKGGINANRGIVPLIAVNITIILYEIALG
jgi:hypothetical protein